MDESGAKENCYYFPFFMSDCHAEINIFVQYYTVTYKYSRYEISLKYEVLKARSTKITGF